MSKPFSTVKLLKGKEPLLRRMLCEVRYQDGQLYLDHTGRLLKKLLRNAAWVVTPEPTTKGTAAFHLVEGFQLSFSMNSASFDLDRRNAEEAIVVEEAENFIGKAEETLGFVLDELEATRFERLGYREWFYFSFDTMDETEHWLRDLGLFSVSPDLAKLFQAEARGLGSAVVLDGLDCRYRVALNAIERAAQLPVGETTLNIRASQLSKNQKAAYLEAMKQQRQRRINSSFAVELDIDTYRNEPIDLDLCQFLRNCVGSNLERCRNSVPKANGKKVK